MTLKLTSSAFQDGTTIPRQHTADGQDVSPPLKWTTPPPGTRSLALICEDPDAPKRTFTHWVLFELPATSTELREGVPVEARLPNGSIQGANDFGGVGFGGPSPPPGKPHRYFFKLFALDCTMALPPGATKDNLQTVMEGHVLEEATLMGTYGR